MAFKKGEPRPEKAGRKEGSVNILTKSVKEAFEIAFNKLQDKDGVKLEDWGEKNPTEFYKLASKLIPTDIKAKVDTTVQQFDLKDTIKQFYERDSEATESTS